MAQVASSNIQTAQSKTTGLSLLSSRSGLGFEGLEANVFADLLSQTTSLQAKTSTTSAQARKRGGQSSDQVAASSFDYAQSSAVSDQSSTRQKLRCLHGDDKTALRDSGKTSSVSKGDSKESYDSSRSEDASDQNVKATANDTTPKSSGGASRKAGICNAKGNTSQTALTGEASNTEGVDGVAVNAEAATFLDAAMAVDAAQDAQATAQDAEGQDNSQGDVQTILDNIVSAEQAALLLLNKIVHEKACVNNDQTADAADGGAQETGAAETTQAVDPVQGGAHTQGTGTVQDVMAKLKGVTNNVMENPFDSQSQPQGQDFSQEGRTYGELLSGQAQNNASKTQNNTETAKNGNARDTFFDLFSAAQATQAPVTASSAITTAAGSKAEAGVTGVGEAGTAAPATQSSGAASQAVVGEGTKPTGSYDFASQLSAARATRGGATGLSNAVEQVALQLHKQVKDGNNEMTVHLKPVELGRVDIKLTFDQNNKVQGTVVADNQATLDLLLKDVGSLQRALQDAGLRADSGSLQFSLRGDGPGGQFNANANANGNGAHNGSGASSYSAGANDDESLVQSAGEVYYLTPGRINFRV